MDVRVDGAREDVQAVGVDDLVSAGERAVIVLGERSIVDTVTVVMALATFGVTWKLKKLPEPVLVVIGAIVGLIAFPGMRA